VGDLYCSKFELEALSAVDARALDAAIHRCLDVRNSYALNAFRLDACGPYVASKAREFDAALRAFAAAKASKKIESTGSMARRKGGSLGSALRRAQEAVETLAWEGETFHVFDDVLPPTRFTPDMSVRVNYQWRASTSSPWTHGSIEFTHRLVSKKDYAQPPSKRVPSAAMAARKQEDDLFAEWDHLRKLALWSVRDYFRDRGVAGDIPQVFPVKLDRYSQRLDNHSAEFWKPQADDDGH